MGFFKGLMLFLGGAVVGVAGTVGGVVIASSVMTVEGTTKMFGVDASTILHEEYYSKTLFDFIQTVSTSKFDTFNDVSKITPLVDDLYDKVDETMNANLAVSLNKTELFSTKFDVLGDYLIEYIKSNASIAKLLNLNDSSAPALKYLCYKTGSDGNPDYTQPVSLGDFIEGNYLTNKIDNARLCDLLDIDESNSILYKLREKKPSELEDSVQDLLLGDVMDIDESSPTILKALKDTKLGELANKANTLTLGEVIDIDSSSPKILLSLKDTTIDGLSVKIDTLTLGEMMVIDSSSPKILQLLSSSTTGSLSNDINAICVKDLYPDSSNNVLNALADDTTIGNFAEKIDDLKFTDIFANEIWGDKEHTEENASTVWRYLLKDGETGEFKTDYKVGFDMGKLTTNVQANVNKATIRELYTDGFLTLEDASVLDRAIIYQGNTYTVGELTFRQFLDATSSII